MDFYRKLEIVLEQKIIPPTKAKTKTKLDFSFDDTMFSKMANFIVNLDPESLSDNQVEEVIGMIEKLEVEVDDIQEVNNPKMARRTNPEKNASSKRWYRDNKMHVKKRKKKFMRSSEGRKRLHAKNRMEKIGKTPSGRKRVRYHVRKKGDEE